MAVSPSAAATERHPCTPAPPQYAELAQRVFAVTPDADGETLFRAYEFTTIRHQGQRRASGDPYASHPIEVAGILADLRLDTASIVTGLLHDTVEDGVAAQGEIETMFGAEIGHLVDGVTKLGKIQLQSRGRRQAENFQKFLLAMSKDIRVLLVKLADRLHNMRTLRFLDDAGKRLRIARETMEIYAPLAERIGMRRLRDELEDLAFGEIHPEERKSLLKRLQFLSEKEGALVPEIAGELRRTLIEAGIDAEVDGRTKQPYSIWRKMEKKHVPFEQIADVIAFRVLVADTAECYRALGAVHGAYPMIPGRFKDYISTPKPNEYRSLHTAVIGPRQRRAEVQIRTHDMHDVAEFGVAAHWRYKQERDEAPPQDGHRYRWLRELTDIVEHAEDAEEVLEHTKLEMYTDRVFCFTPRGEIVSLPNGATPVDLAYAVHSDVGDTCVGAKVNGRLAPLRTILENGDQVEILRSSVPAPDPKWESFAVTGKARARIRRFVRQQSENEYASLGRAILEKAFRSHGRLFDDSRLEDVLDRFGHGKPGETCAAVGRGELAASAVLTAVCPDLLIEARTASHRPAARRGTGDAVPIKGLTPGMAVHMAECCHPLSGDRIVGIIVEGHGVAVHTIDCHVLESFANAPERWLDLSWDPDSEASPIQVGRIVAVMSNVPGSLNALTEVIARADGNIINLQNTDRSPDFFEFVVDVEVADVRQLTDIVTALRANPAFFQVERARG